MASRSRTLVNLIVPHSGKGGIAMDPSAVDRTGGPSNEGVAEEEGLWSLAKARGISRRRFLQLTALGGGAAVLAACGVMPGSTPTARPEPTLAPAARTPSEVEEARPWFKDPGPFIVHNGSLEARLENVQGVTTPNRYFFVRNNSASVDVDVAGWRLSIEGDGVSDPVEFSYDDIRNMPSRTVVSYLECAGNHRSMFEKLKGQQTSGTQWGLGAVGSGEWTGVPLRDLLTEAGIKGEARSVLLVGQDQESPEAGFRRALPVEKAMHPDTLLAYSLNGETLPRDHGYPLRALVPGWVGSSSIKWLRSIAVSSEMIWTRNNTTHYVLIGDKYPREESADGRIITTQVVNSALALPWPASLSAGEHRLYGFAHSPHGQIVKVEWSEDSGGGWREADIAGPQVQYSWVRFEFTWDASPGNHRIVTRATDSEENVQPESVPFNEKGYLFNEPIPHPIRVS